MKQDEIVEIQGVWTVEDIQNVMALISGQEGEQELKDIQVLAKEQAKQIHEIAHVDMNQLKVPFTFNM